MIKNLTLSKQITIILITAFIITTVLLGIFLSNNLNDIYEENIYDSLEAEAKTIRFFVDPYNYRPADNIAFITFLKDDKEYISSYNINEYISEKDIILLLKKVKLQKETSGRYVNIINNKPIYYIILKFKGFFDILDEQNILVLTDDTIKNQQVRNTFVKLFISCFIAFFIGYILIILWTRYLLVSIKKTRNSILKMPGDHYMTSIESKRKDEFGQLVKSIDDMRSQILNSNQTKQEMIQGISHDLKTPVSVIQSYAEAVEDDMIDPIKAAKIILKQTKRLTEKVTNLLNLTRLDHISTDPKELKEERIDPVLYEILDLYRVQPDVSIEADIKEAVLFGDIESWRIAFENLFDNAVRYAKTKIVIKLDTDYFSIYNDGNNISSDIISGIFKPYEKSRDGKFGLGLSIVNRTVSLFGYRIEVSNKLDGVEFVIKK